MPFTNYTELQTAVLGRLLRSADSEAVALCPDWITLAEDEIRLGIAKKDLRQGETVNASFSITTALTALPTGYIRYRSLKLSNGKQLEWRPLSEIDRWENVPAGIPQEFTIQGNQIRVLPAPDGTYTATMSYFSLPPLSVGSPTNWLLTAHPKLYFVATVAEAAAHYENAELAQAYEFKRQDLIDRIFEADSVQQQGNSLRVKVRTVV